MRVRLELKPEMRNPCARSVWASRGIDFGMCRELGGGNDERGVGIATNTVDSASGACTNGVGVAAGMLSSDGDGTIGATHDGAFVIKGMGAAEINEEARVFGAAHKGDGRADFNAEGLVGTWRRR